MTSTIRSLYLNLFGSISLCQHEASNVFDSVYLCIGQPRQGTRQLVGDEGSNLPNGKLLCLWKYKAIETVHQGQLTDNWTETSFHLLLLKGSMVEGNSEMLTYAGSRPQTGPDERRFSFGYFEYHSDGLHWK